MNIVDGIFVARLSEKALTATSLAYPIQILMVAASVGTGVGVNALISRLLGAKKQEEANKIATTGLILALICTLIFAVLGIFCVETFVSMFTQDQETGAYCETYLRICMIFCIGIFLETLAQRSRRSSDSVWGAATALLLNHFRNPDIHFAVKGFRFSGKSVLEIYKVGLPTIIMQAVGSIMISVINGILMPISFTAVAFFGAYYKLQNFLMMPMNGLGQAAIPIVGFNYGAKNGERIKKTLGIMILRRFWDIQQQVLEMV